MGNLLNIPTLADWSVLINALMAGLMIGYGFWIHHIVKQQEKFKDAAIQALQAALTAKEAEISRLASDTAPNIVKAYEAMREHADKMTADVIKLQEKILRAQAELRKQAYESTADFLDPAFGMDRDAPPPELDALRTELAEKLVSEASGLNLSKTILIDKFEKYMLRTSEPPTFQALRESIWETFDAISKEFDTRVKEAQESLKNPKH